MQRQIVSDIIIMSNTYLMSKPRYEILDGLRGVAALMVVAFHLFETYSKGPAYQIINHGYLAVDFFFVLSGFVIGYAYDDRWDRMTLGNFFKRRLIRLHPMVIFGMVFGLLTFYLGESSGFPNIAHTSVGQLLLVFVLGCTLLPLPIGMDVRGWTEMHPLNGPAWSLYFEYIANILYAFVLRKLPVKVLAVLVACFALLTINLSMNLNWFGVWQDRTATAYTMIGGWALNAEQQVVGFSRLLYPFFMGLLLSRCTKKHLRVKGGFWVCSLIIIVCQAMPHLGGESHPWMNGLFDCLVVLFVFPLVVSLGAGSTLQGKYGTKVCQLLGNISYPLYITHYPLLYIQMEWAWRHADAPPSVHAFVACSTFLLSVALAYAAWKLYDMPVREWLSKKIGR